MKELTDCSRNELIDILKQQNVRIAELEGKIARLSKTASTPSKPPSSDVTKPAKGGKSAKVGGTRKREIGADPGHQKHQRKPCSPGQIDQGFS